MIVLRVARGGALACVILCAITIFGPVAAAASSVQTAGLNSGLVTGSGSGSDLAARKAAIQKALAAASATYEGASARVQAAAARYAEATAKLAGAQEDLANANGSVIAASVTAHQATIAVTNTQTAATNANAAVVTADHRVQAQRAAISSVATAVYQGSSFLGLDSLLTSGSPGAVLDRFGYANEIVGAQDKVLNRYLAARMSAKEALNRARAAVTTAADAQTAATTALAKSKRTKATAAKAQAAVTALIAARRAALGAAQKYKAEVLAQYDQLQKENKQVEAQLKAQAAADRAAAKKKTKSRSGSGSSSSSSQASASTSSGVRSGYFIMPIHGWKSSNFGMRYDPIYKRWQLHAGVDIAAPTGTLIHAARAGRVIRAGWDGGYGNYTCIDTGLFQGKGPDHNKDIANCYAHQSRILVHVGEHVSLGQTIGRVGETGAATGPHLHFEVRVDGTPVQPLNWLPKCFC